MIWNERETYFTNLLERNIESVGAGAGDEEGEGDDEDKEVEGEVTLEDGSILPLDEELDAREDDEDKRRHLGVEAKEEHDRAHHLDGAVESDEEVSWAEVNGVEGGDPARFLTLELEDAEVEEDESEDKA